jgi:hypothetical protein
MAMRHKLNEHTLNCGTEKLLLTLPPFDTTAYLEDLTPAAGTDRNI